MDRVSPTAHYTGEVWLRNGLSHPVLATREGRLMFAALQPAMLARRLGGGPTLEQYLLARHAVLDELLSDAIDNQGITQVLEIGAGMSPRGWRFTERYGPALTYLETDLAAMADRKRAALERIGARPPGHRVRELDALRDTGPASLASVAAHLEPGRGLVVVNEGLLSYLPRHEVLALWARVARTLDGFTPGRYLFDLGIGRALTDLPARAFRLGLGAFVRGRVHEHFADDDVAVARLHEAGFGEARIVRPSRSHPTRSPRLVDARTKS